DIVAHAIALRPQHQRHLAAVERLAERRPGIAGQTDAPILRLGDLIERARQVDDAYPRHGFERTRRGARDDTAFGRAVSVLRDDGGSIEGRSRAKHRTDI